MSARTALAACLVAAPVCLAESPRLKPCGTSPNCVSSLATDKKHRVEPLRFDGEAADAWRRLQTVLRSMKRRNNGQVAEQWDWRKTLTSRDIRFTIKAGVLYAIALRWPEDGRLVIRSLGDDAGAKIGAIALLGHKDPLSWERTSQGLEVRLPAKRPCEYAYALKITEKN